MIDPNKEEQESMHHASAAAGEYLESLGRTDLAQFSLDEWMTLIEVIATAFDDAMRERGRERIPF